MINLSAKAKFLRQEYITHLQKLSTSTTPQWGKMNVQQMIEHMADAFAEAYGNPVKSLVTPEENLGKMQDFLKSEKAFKENTKNVNMPDEPTPVRFASKEEALEDLQQEIANFFLAFESEKKKYVMNPFFGELDYGLSIQLLHKHSTHHLRQFGVAV